MVGRSIALILPSPMKGLSRRTRRSHLWDLLSFALVVLALLAVIRLLPGPEPRETQGRARALDGDSLVLDRVEIRLSGIDAPEFRQTCSKAGRTWPCGREAARRLRDLVGGRVLTCAGRASDAHGRLLAVCRAGDREINRWMVENGWAVSFDAYPAAERAARAAGRGLWAGEFERPADWRERNRAGR